MSEEEYQPTPDDIRNAENIILPEQRTMPKDIERFEKLFSMFKETNGVFKLIIHTTREETHLGFSRNPNLDREPSVQYYIGDQEISEDEHKALQTRIDEIPVPDGFFRIPDARNTLEEIVYPQENYTVVVTGKIGQSKRGVAPTGIIYQGDLLGWLQRKKINPYERVREISINGVHQLHDEKNLSLFNEELSFALGVWDTPIMKAIRALWPKSDLLSWVSSWNAVNSDYLSAIEDNRRIIALAKVYEHIS